MLKKVLRNFSISLKRKPLISIQELNQLPKENTKFVDCSIIIPKDPPYPYKSNNEIFQKKRIPGAVHFDIDVISEPGAPFPHTMPNPNFFIENMKRLDLSKDDNIVLYDSYGIAGVSRTWYMLQTYGHNKSFILDGGLPAYEKSGLEMEMGVPKNKPTNNSNSFDYKLNDKLVVSHYETQNYSYQLKKGYIDNVEILDARNPKRFNKEIPEPRPGVRGGNVPMSKNLNYETLLKDPFTFESEENLRKTYLDHKINLDNFLINMCGSGVTGSVLFVSQRLLGTIKNAVYDGSWTEYGTLPEYKDEEIEKRIREPVSQKLIPKQESLEPGKTYSWCACGLSKKITFCDGSHRSTTFKSLKFQTDKDSTVKKLICRCKNTKNPPYCDLTHVKVITNHYTGKEIFSDITCNRM